MRQALIVVLLLIGVGCWTAAAADPSAAPKPTFAKLVEKIELNDGDTLVFLGDSITHQCLYTQYVEDYFYTRYPQKKIRFHNAGVGGDRAADALARFDQDVAAFKPKYVTVLLGMNDGSYGQWTPEMFATYEKDMTALIERIRSIGAVPVLMTPTMYDTRAALLKPSAKRPADHPVNKYYNASLAYLGAWVREQAINQGLGFVDMYNPLNNLTIAQRKADPDFTFIADAVHPAADGQFIMAYSILEQMHRNSAASMLNGVHDGKQWKITAAKDAKISQVAGSAEGLSFTHQAASLPWIVPADAATGYRLTAAGHRLSNQTFRMGGLAPGWYELKIDGRTIGTYSHTQLAIKIELQGNDKTPEHQQALAVAMLNKERNEQAMWPLRNVWRDLKVKRRAGNAEELAKFMTDFDAKVEALKQSVADYDRKIYAMNQPQAHRYELVRAAAPTPAAKKAPAKKAASR
jgi:lysophospholipase L1-like esterase